MGELSSRLLCAADLIKKGARVADIGTDHAYLPIYLIKNNIADYCICADVRQKPLNNAAANIASAGIKNAETRLSNGFSAFSAGDFDTAVIAGMGGEAIANIIDNCGYIKSPSYTLILQAMTSADYLRRYLCKGGFKIVAEKACLDSGRIYSVIKAVYTGDCFVPNAAFCAIGALDLKDSLARQYTLKQLKNTADLRNALKSVPEKQNEYRKAESLAAELEKLLGV